MAAGERGFLHGLRATGSRSNGFVVGHITPEDVKLTDEEIAARKAAWTQPAPRYTRGVLAKYAKLVVTASKGAVTDKYL